VSVYLSLILGVTGVQGMIRENSRPGAVGLKGYDGGCLGREVKGVATRQVGQSVRVIEEPAQVVQCGAG
jgi:hypothetical protein